MLPVKIENGIIRVEGVEGITGIKVVPIILLILLSLVGCSALFRAVAPVEVEKTIVVTKVDTVADETLVAKLKNELSNERKKRKLLEKEVVKEKYSVDKELNDLKKSLGSNTTTNVKKLHGYTPFEIAMYFLKAHENFSPKEYPDGDYNSKGFGLNLNPDHVEWATKQLGFPCRKRNWTYNEGTKLLYAYYQEKKDLVKEKYPNLNEFQITALVLHAYNTGNTKSIEGCCGSVKGCGRKVRTQLDRDIKRVHNERRKFEHALFNQKITLKQIEMYKERAAKINSKWKNS